MSIFRPKNLPPRELGEDEVGSKMKWFHWGVLGVFILVLGIFLTSSIDPTLPNYERGGVATVIAAKDVKSKPLAIDKPTESNRIILKFKNDKQTRKSSIVAEINNLEKVYGLKKILEIEAIGALVYEISENDTAFEVVNKIKHNDKGLIEYIEVDMLVPPSLVSGEVEQNNQWHHQNIKLLDAWKLSQGEGVTVAVLDTGVNKHEDLRFSTEPGWNFYNNDSNTADINGHGTAVAGTISAIGDNNIGVSGVAPKSEILPIRISDSSARAYLSAMAQGIIYAADHGARVANLSYGHSCNSSLVLDSARYLRSKGGVVVMSAENTGNDNGMLSSEEVICVSATGSDDLRATWSSYGESIDVTAPGTDIDTTSSDGTYSSWSGTSFSAPITAGIYALLFSVNHSLSPGLADSILFSTVDDLGDEGWDIYYGYGKVNANKAVELAAATTTSNVEDNNSPAIPNKLRSAKVGAENVSLVWKDSSDDSLVSQYGIYRDWAKIDEVTGAHYVDVSVTPQSNYTYTVTAIDKSGNESGNSVPVSVITPSLPFSIISDFVKEKTSNSAKIEVRISSAGTVAINYGTDVDDLNQTTEVVESKTLHTITLSGLESKKTYYYKVSAINADDKKTNSTMASFKIGG